MFVFAEMVSGWEASFSCENNTGGILGWMVVFYIRTKR